MKPIELLVLLVLLSRRVNVFSREDEEFLEFAPVEYIKTRSLTPLKEKQPVYRVIKMKNSQFIDLGNRVTQELWEEVENSDFSYVLHVNSEENSDWREKLLEILFK